MSETAWSSQLAPLWSVLFLAGVWLTVTGLLSRLGGWATLAVYFRPTQATSGDNFRFVSGSMGKRGAPVGYRNCLFVSVGERGIALSILFLFRFGSPPLFIPWSSVESVDETKVFFVRYVAIRLRGQWPVVSLCGPAAERVLQIYAGLPSSRAL